MKKKPTTKAAAAKGRSKPRIAKASRTRPIAAKTQEARDWRDETLAQVRNLIAQADPDVIEEIKWRKPSNAMRGVPVWSHAGIICTGET